MTRWGHCRTANAPAFCPACPPCGSFKFCLHFSLLLYWLQRPDLRKYGIGIKMKRSGSPKDKALFYFMSTSWINCIRFHPFSFDVTLAKNIRRYILLRDYKSFGLIKVVCSFFTPLIRRTCTLFNRCSLGHRKRALKHRVFRFLAAQSAHVALLPSRCIIGTN